MEKLVDFKSWMIELTKKGLDWSLENEDISIESAIEYWADVEMWKTLWVTGESVQDAFDHGIEMWDEIQAMKEE